MVSGLVTSPLDQDRICLEEASPMMMASTLLMSIKCAQCSRCRQREGWAVRSGQCAGLRVTFCALRTRALRTRRSRSRLTLRFHVFSVLFLGRLVRLAALALGEHRVLGLVGRLGRRCAHTREV